ncbi:S8 family serine peptidase [Candidatus Bipolaricaulota bacterium]|nr:S8 family serine peptidase [Candidatus Bipolaricaulota bacterium]
MRTNLEPKLISGQRFLALIALLLITFLIIPVLTTAQPKSPPEKPLPPEAANPKLENKLQVLEDRWAESPAAGREYAQSRGIPVENGKVRVIIEPSGLPGGINRTALEARGGEVEATSRSLMAVKIPATMLKAVAGNVNGISFIRTPFPKKTTKVDTSEGVTKTSADEYHDAGFSGQGADVAIIDLGFDHLTEAKDSGDIPPSVIEFTKDYTGNGLETDYQHGTEVAEIVHDMAPEADLYLMKVFDTVDLENAVDDAIAEGVDVINHSIGWFNVNFYDGTGPADWGTTGTNVADIAAYARDNGILWVNSNGNSAQNHWQGSWTDSDGDDLLNFTSNSNRNYIDYVSEGSWIDIYMTWDAWPSDAEDYDICLDRQNDDGTWDYFVRCSSDIQDGSQRPTESIYFQVPSGEAGDYYFSILYVDAQTTPDIDLFAYVNNSGQISGYPVNSSSVLAPANDGKVFSVGAINESDWTTGPQASYSSLGPSNASQYTSSRIKPDVMGPDCVSTSGFGTFCGTSASSPHLAGAAALLLSEDSSRTADDLQSILESNAIDMGDSGNDNTYGWGRMEMPSPSTGTDTGADTDAVFRVDNEGNVYSDSDYYGEGFETGSADLAEKVKVTEPVEPGDVLALDPDNPKQYRKSSKPYSDLAAGVVSTKPGYTLSEEGSEANVPMALLGTVPVKATTENGPIGLGDLLTTSSKPGYAMVCNEPSKCSGAIVGKALASLEQGEGKIRILLVN